MERGVVRGLDRLNGVANVELLGGPTVPAIYLNEPPPPLTVVWLDQSSPGAWVVIGCEGGRRFVMHDDFIIRIGTNTPATFGYGDHIWYVSAAVGNGMYDTTLAEVAGADTWGVVGLDATGAGGVYTLMRRSWNKMPPGWAIWLSYKVALSVVSTALIHEGGVGHGDGYFITGSDPGFGARFDASASPNWQLYTRKTAVKFTASTLPAAANTWYWIDLLCKPSSFSAMWIDGTLAATDATQVPAGSDNLTPGFLAFQGGAGGVDCHVELDVVHLELVRTVVTP